MTLMARRPASEPRLANLFVGGGTKVAVSCGCRAFRLIPNAFMIGDIVDDCGVFESRSPAERIFRSVLGCASSALVGDIVKVGVFA
jgi:hypothetical protein